MNTPIMLAPIFRTDSTAQVPAITEIVATIRAAAANASAVMPPLAAQEMAESLHELADAVEHEHLGWWARLNSRLEHVDEINAYAARARQHVEHEAFLGGTTPDDATYVQSAETLAAALAELPDAGVAHREVTRFYGPWVIDRPAQTGAAA